MRYVAAVFVCLVLAPEVLLPARGTSAAAGAGEVRRFHSDDPPVFGDWSPGVGVETIPGSDVNVNTPFLDGCPAVSRDGLNLYMASNRPNGEGGLDIWVSKRQSVEDGWGEPQNLGPAINTLYDEFCPTPTGTHGLLFVSTRPACGGADIYVTRYHATRGWTEPVHIGCHVNSAADEASPFIVEHDNGVEELYFSSTRAGGFAPDSPGAVAGDSDIYVSVLYPDGSFGSPQLVPGVNTAAQDARPNVRRDAREIFFDSNRPGSAGFDIWAATRESPFGDWSAPVKLGPNVNSGANETRAFLSWDRLTLYFGSTRPGEGSTDLYFSTREK